MRKQGHKVACLEPEPALMEMLEAAGFVVYQSLESIAPGSLDGIYTLNVLEHIENDRAILSSLHDCIRPGGQLYIYVPAFQSLFSAMDRKVGHVRRYRLAELVEKCRKAGFEVTAGGYVDSLGFLASLAYRLLGAGDGTLSGNTIRLYDRYVFPLSQVLDSLTSRFFGKNVWVHARRPNTNPCATASTSTSDLPNEYR
jgi:SAM-dependent methyltransferase